MALIAAKNSILTFYLILTYRVKVFYRANWVLLFITNAIGVALTITAATQCHPVTAIYHLETQTKKECTNTFISAISTVPYNIATDIAILFIPVPLLTRIALPFRQRLILVITFSAGIMLIVVDIARVAILQKNAESRLIAIHSYYTEDITDEDYTC